MMKIVTGVAAAALALTLSIASHAQDENTDSVLIGDFAGCVKENQGVRGMTGACLQDALRNCNSAQVNSPPAIVCYMSARDEFTGQIATRLAEIAEQDNARIHLIAGVEVKYDTKANMIDCERQRELNFLGGANKIQIEYVNARCETRAMAQTYIQLLAKSGWFNEE